MPTELKEASSGDSSESEFEHVWTPLLTKSRCLLGLKSTTCEPVVIVAGPAVKFPPMMLCTL